MKVTRIQQLALSLLLCAGATRCLAQASQQTLPEGSPIRVRLDQDLSSATAEEGQLVQLSAAEDVRVGDTVVIKQGAAVVGRITEAVQKRRMGRTGKLDFSVERVVAVDGTSIPLRYSPIKKEGGSRAVQTGLITAGVAVAFWPAAPFVLLAHGKDVTLHRGLEADVFTDRSYSPSAKALAAANNGNMSLTPAIAYSQGMSTTSPVLYNASMTVAGGPLVPVQITSEPTGAEITVDGAFVGSTPETTQMTPGLHRIAVKRGQATWERDLSVQPGNLVPVNAILSRR